MRTLSVCILFCLFGIKTSSQEPKLMLPIGHQKAINSLVFSADCKKVVSASNDKTAKIWDFQSGLLLASLEGHSEYVSDARFSPDDNYILTLSSRLIKIWDSKTYNFICNIGLDSFNHYTEFSPDSKKIVTVPNENSLMIWDVASGALITKCIGNFILYGKPHFSHDNKYIIAASNDNTVGIWDVITGKPVRLFKGHTSHVFDIEINDDGTKIVTASYDSSVKVWETSTGKLLFTLDREINDNLKSIRFDKSGTQLIIHYKQDLINDQYSKAKIWDCTTGKLVYEFKKEKNDKTFNRVTTFEVSPDGSKIFNGSGDSLFIWDRATGIKIGKNINIFINDWSLVTFNKDESECVLVDTWDIFSINLKTLEIKKFLNSRLNSRVEHLSPDGKYLFTAKLDLEGEAKIWDMESGKILPSKLVNFVEEGEYSPDGRIIAVTKSMFYRRISPYMSVRILDARSGELLHEIGKDTSGIFKVKFSPDGSKLVTLSRYRDLKIWDAKNFRLLKEIKNVSKYNIKFYDSYEDDDIVSFSSDNSKLIYCYKGSSSSNNAGLVIWDVNTGQRIDILKEDSAIINNFSVSSDSKQLLLNLEGISRKSSEQNVIPVTNLKVWDIAKRKYIIDFKSFKKRISYVAFSNEGNKTVAAMPDGEVHIRDVKTTKLLTVFCGHTERVYFAEFSSTGKRLLTCSKDNSAKVWDVETGKLLLDLKGSLLDYSQAHFSNDGKYILTKSPDKTLKKWDALTGELMYTFFTVNEDDYLVVDKYGRYDGTPGARKLLYFTCNNEIIKLEQFEDLCWEPGLASKINGINKEPITAQKLTEINICNITPEVIQDENAGDNYQYTIHPRNGGLGEVQLYVNGKLIKTEKKENLIKKENDYSFAVKREWVQSYFISGSANQVTVKATTGEGTMSSRGIDIEEIPTGNKTANPNIYIVSVGINKYKAEKIRLNYASTDALSFGSAVTASAKKLLNSDGKEHVFSYSFNTETNSLFWPSKDSIQKKMEEIAKIAKPEDILVFFFAGHGVLQSGQKKLYLLTAEATGFEMGGVENKVAISTDELGRWMQNIKANKQILIMDACNSGEGVASLQEMFSKRDIPADQVRVLENLNDKNGTFILSASASGQSAYETSQFGQGLLTYSLLSGIKNQTALKENKYIDVTQWFNNASNNVRTLAKEIGRNQEPQLFGNASFDVGLVDVEVMNGIKLASPKKIVSRTKLFSGNPSLLLDPLQLETEIDKELNNFSFAGKESSLTFIENNVSPETYSIRGSYEIKGKSVTATLSLIKQNSSVKVFTETGNTEALDVFAKKIVTDISNYLKTVGSERIN